MKMTEEQFLVKEKELQHLAPQIPLYWGAIQNDVTDAIVNLFSCNTYSKLQKAIATLTLPQQQYFLKRWFLWQCAQCDEYLFYSQPQCRRNPNRRDSVWDVELFGEHNYRFDIKSTKLPKQFQYLLQRGGSQQLNEQLFQFYYLRQSMGVRGHFQNRLFFIHIPYQPEHENLLRARFSEKHLLVTNFLRTTKNTFHTYIVEHNKTLACFLYLIEQKNGQLLLRNQF